MEYVRELAGRSWGDAHAPGATEALEAGVVLHLPELPFGLTAAERRFLTPAVTGRSKNVSYDPATGQLGGSTCAGADAADLAALVGRYSACAARLVGSLFPEYAGRLARARASYRPVEVAGRSSSWRKDDTRLHVDSFPSSPTGGRRILRVFCNVNPEGKPRTWRVGEPFPAVARQFWPHLRGPVPGSGPVLRLLRMTRGLRTEYDHYMLQLHDRMKIDMAYQGMARQSVRRFPPGSTWVCFTDQVSHAALAGAFQFEQTFHLGVDDMLDPATSPLRVLEGLAGRPLAPAAPRRRAA